MTVSLCVVAQNEEKFLPNLLKDLQSQTYDHSKTEIVLVDSMSTDSTLSIMQEFKLKENGFYNIQILYNPKKIQAAGWNIAIQAAKSDVIIRIDAHSKIPSDFAMKNMKLQEEGEYVTGGVRPCIIDDPTPWKNMLLEVENSLFGSSINKSRHAQQKSYVKTMFHAAYRKKVFKKSGLFNEKLLRTEDNEMHYRIRKAGYKFCYDPTIVSYQYARSSLKQMIKQKYNNGVWIGKTLFECPKCLSVYHFVPFAFVIGIFVTTILSLCRKWQLAGLMWSLYLLFSIYSEIVSAINKKANGFTLIMPFIFLILHTSYGIGTAIGLIKSINNL